MRSACSRREGPSPIVLSSCVYSGTRGPVQVARARVDAVCKVQLARFRGRQSPSAVPGPASDKRWDSAVPLTRGEEGLASSSAAA